MDRVSCNASRFFVDKNSICEGEVCIESGDARHISVVLRKTAGDRIIVCDGCGMDYECELTFASTELIRARINSSYPSMCEPPVKVILYQSLLKSDKFEYVIEKCTEAGVNEIVPVASERVQFMGAMKDGNADKKLGRWQSIALAAAKQSGRGIVPMVRGCISFSAAISDCVKRMAGQPVDKLALIPYENEMITSLKSELTAFKQLLSNSGACGAHASIMHEIYLFIGPEGGYTALEIDLCRQNAIIPVTLGPRIYKAETAGLASLCQIMYEFELD